MNEDVIIHAQLFGASSSGLYLAESCRFKSQPVLYFYHTLYSMCSLSGSVYLVRTGHHMIGGGGGYVFN